ncbi:MAG: DUF1080 domain-containing protein [Verrucomicrobia bacterium]|nr:DUF1080 domain-containing protein [Verrucomicrobiota bacterium]MBT7065199.1 DUF1080 domain-containing protein [Verrucomicrobiota bacterium]MBT7700911.1 DUF1080 domain-containing protein [Verrucomicrobiota bacterium]
MVVALLVATVGSVQAAGPVTAQQLDKVFENYDKVSPSGWGESSRPQNVLSAAERRDGWHLLFDGKTLAPWRAAESKDSFAVKDGLLVVKGKRGHLFYAGPVKAARFKNFHFKADVLTKPKANSGLYFHTAFQAKGWPRQGYEAQVNNSGKDPKRTGGLYGAANNMGPVAKDNTWFHYEIIVSGTHVVLKIDGKTITDYNEAQDVDFPGWPGRRLSEGTFAIQAHDPGSEVHYRNIKVKPLD